MPAPAAAAAAAAASAGHDVTVVPPWCVCSEFLFTMTEELEFSGVRIMGEDDSEHEKLCIVKQGGAVGVGCLCACAVCCYC